MLPYTDEDVDTLYRLLGKALWHLQHLENIVASFTAFKILQAKREKGKKISEAFAKDILANQQRGTLGPIIGAAKQHGSIPGPFAIRFEGFLEERNWLIHRCVKSEYLSLRNSSSKDELFNRIKKFSNEAINLQNEIHMLFESWYEGKGYNFAEAYKLAEEQLKNSEQR